jgi:aryl-phospho-beta-D-glucosidase BglC (GH1 family)
MKIKGVNLGNWLVLEKWMSPGLFAGTVAEDEYDLPRSLLREVYEARIKIHRAEYITERDFVKIKSMGLNMIRIPVPFFIFGDVEPYIGCVEELDKAFCWASRYGLKILIDLHTVPGGQNGFDNGGISGVCKWAQDREKVEFTLSVLERLAERYGTHEALFGIQPVNEPISEDLWNAMNVQERYKPADRKMAEGSAGVPRDFLKAFYQEAYERIRKYLPEEKAIVLHDGFDLTGWKDFMQEEHYQNVWLDTHQYLTTAEGMGYGQSLSGYLKFITENLAPQIEEMEHYFPVICGEWCLFNSMVVGCDTKGGQTVLNGVKNASAETMSDAEKKDIYRALATAQIAAWNRGHGYFFWSYKLLTDTVNTEGWIGFDAWDLGRCHDFGWFPNQSE